MSTRQRAVMTFRWAAHSFFFFLFNLSVVLSLPKVRAGLSLFSLGLPAPCYLALATAPVTSPSPHRPPPPCLAPHAIGLGIVSPRLAVHVRWSGLVSARPLERAGTTRKSATGVGERMFCPVSVWGSGGGVVRPHLAELNLAHVSARVSCARGEWKGHSIACL